MVEISYQDLFYLIKELPPTFLMIYLYVIGHKDKVISKDEMTKALGVDSTVLYKARNELKRVGAGDIDADGNFVCYNVIWGEDKPYTGYW